MSDSFSTLVQYLARHPWRCFAVYMMLAGLLYALCGRAPSAAALVIEPTALDLRVPFTPAAAVLYATYALVLPVFIIVARHRPEFPYVLGAGLASALASSAVYNLFPSRIAERPAAPAGTLLELMQMIDTPYCAIPCGHVTLPAAVAVAAMAVSQVGANARFWRSLSAWFAIWTLALGASTLLTKQHYVVDLGIGMLFGPGLALFALWLLRPDGPSVTRPRMQSRAWDIYSPTLVALLVEWCVITLTVLAVMQRDSALAALLGAAVIASRQHALIALYHDGVHGLAARNLRLNDFLTNTTIGVPLMLPVHMYRALHQSHHRYLGQECDPERVLLYRCQPWNFAALRTKPLLLQLLGDVSGWNGAAMTVRYFREAAKGSMNLVRARPHPELLWQFFAMYGLLAAAFALWPEATLKVALLWFVPYLTLTQLLQKIRSFAEHTRESDDGSLSCSWSPGILGRLTIWPYNINYHREHHARADIPWNRLPAAFPSIKQRPGGTLLAHVWSRERT